MVSDSDVPYRVQVAVGTHGYVANMEGLQQTTIPTLRQSQDTGGEPGEQSLNTEGLWRRSGSDWSLGSGQRVYDREDSSRRRFFHSQGVDVWTRHECSLLNSTSLSRANGGASWGHRLIVASGNLYHFDRSDIFYNSAPFASGVWTAITRAATSLISDLATNGTTIWAAYSSGLDKVEGATLTSGFAVGNFACVGYANGRLLVGSGDSSSLYEVNSNGSLTLVFTHPDSSFRWTEITGAPNGIYLAGSSGIKSETYIIASTEASGALAVPVYAGSLPEGETVNVMTFYGGIMLIGTSRGIRLANISGGGGLVHGPLIRINDFRDTTTQRNGIHTFSPRGEFVWFDWVDTFGGVQGSDTRGTNIGLGRLDLSRFTEPLVPAYASDLDSTAAGSAVLSVVSMDGNLAFVDSSSGVYVQSTSTLVSSGYIDTGEVLYGTTETKVVASADVSHEPLDGSVTVSLIDSDGVETTLGTSSTAGSTGPSSEFVANDSVGERFRLKVTLTRDSTNTSTGPVLRRWTTKALVAPERVDEIILPVMLFDRVETVDGEYLDLDTKAEYLYLKGLEADGTVVDVKVGDSTYSCRLDRVQMQPIRWNDTRTFFEGVCTLRFITVKPVV